MFGSGGCAGRRCRCHDGVHHYAGRGASCHDVDHLGGGDMVAMVGKESKKTTCFTCPRFSSQPTPGKLKRHLGNKHRLLKHPPITLDYLSPFLHLCSQTLIVCADIHRNSQNSISVNMNNNNEDLDSTAACFRFFLSLLCFISSDVR